MVVGGDFAPETSRGFAVARGRSVVLDIVQNFVVGGLSKERDGCQKERSCSVASSFLLLLVVC